MRYRHEDPQQESQEQSTEELGEDVLLVKMAAGPHTVRPAPPTQASILFPCIKAVFPVAATFVVDSSSSPSPSLTQFGKVQPVPVC